MSRSCRRLVAAALTLLGASCLAASSARAAAAPVVNVKPSATVALQPRRAGQARISVTVDPGYHVQANPPSAEYLIPTRLTLKGEPGLTVGKVIYPKGQPFKLQGSDEELSTYMGTFDLVVPLRASASLRRGAHVLKGTLRYQACDATVCYAPVSVPLEVHVQVSGGGRHAAAPSASPPPPPG